MTDMYTCLQQEQKQTATFRSDVVQTATGCTASQVQAGLPVAVDNETKARHREPVIWPHVAFVAPNWPVHCSNHLCVCRGTGIASWWTVEGYRVMSLSSSSLEEMRRRCMVRVMFNKWLLPHTPPSGSARQNAQALVKRQCNKVEQHYRTSCHLLKIRLVSVTCGFPWHICSLTHSICVF